MILMPMKARVSEEASQMMFEDEVDTSKKDKKRIKSALTTRRNNGIK